MQWTKRIGLCQQPRFSERMVRVDLHDNNEVRRAGENKSWAANQFLGAYGIRYIITINVLYSVFNNVFEVISHILNAWEHGNETTKIVWLFERIDRMNERSNEWTIDLNRWMIESITADQRKSLTKLVSRWSRVGLDLVSCWSRVGLRLVSDWSPPEA